MKKATLIRIATWISAAAMSGALVYIGFYTYEALNRRSLDRQIHELYYALPPYAVPLLNMPKNTDESSDAEELPAPQPSQYERLQPFLEINPDFVAIIKIPGTDMVLPIVHGTDNVKYLDTSFEGTRSKHGALFLDSGNNGQFTDPNNVLYGHNMNDGTMLRGIMAYQNMSHYEEAPIIELDGLHGTDTWLIFAAYVCEPTFPYFYTHFPDGFFSQILDEIQRRSVIRTGVDVNEDDILLTLSTCAYDFDNARFAVHARLLRDGEELSQ